MDEVAGVVGLLLRLVHGVIVRCWGLLVCIEVEVDKFLVFIGCNKILKKGTLNPCYRLYIVYRFDGIVVIL